MGGGIPLGTLMIIFGGRGSGKSVMCQQFAYGALKEGREVTYISSEHTIPAILSNMENLSLSVENAFVDGKFRITPVHTRYGTIDNTLNMLAVLEDYIRKQTSELIIVDSLSFFADGKTDGEVYRFFITCKRITEQQKIVFVTIPHFFMEEVHLERAINLCDTVMEIRMREMGEKIARVLKIDKMKTLGEIFQEITAFEVDPAFGIRVSPILEA